MLPPRRVAPFCHCHPRPLHSVCRSDLMQRCRRPFSRARTFPSSCVMSRISFRRHHSLHLTTNCPSLSAAQRPAHRLRTSVSCSPIRLPFLFHFSFLTRSGFHQVSFPECRAHLLPFFSFLSWSQLSMNSLHVLPSQSPVHFSEFREGSRSDVCLAQMQASFASRRPVAITAFPLSSHGFVGVHKRGMCHWVVSVSGRFITSTVSS